MFTGIIEEVGKIHTIRNIDKGKTFRVQCDRILSDLKAEDSVAVNGVCLTAEKVFSDGFEATAVEETLEKSILSRLSQNDLVNLERAVRMQDRLGGHMVTGHVDAMTEILNIESRGTSYWLEVKIPDHLNKYIIQKGSIAIHGVSLTVASRTHQSVSVAVIPYTYQNTNLKHLKAGDPVNIETDIIGKYLESFLKNTTASSGYSEDQLRAMGY